MKALASSLVLGGALLALAVVSPAQNLPPGTTWAYQLIEGSQLVDDCPVCDRIPIVQPLRGSFELRALQPGPLFSHYAIENICFTNGNPDGPFYKMTGSGRYQIGGELAVVQELTLDLAIDNRVLVKQCFFTNTSSMVSRRWPMFQIQMSQTNGTLTQQFTLELNAAPLRDIWFSATDDFTAQIWNPPTNVVGNGDLLSMQGRRVKTNHALTARLGIMPPVPDLGLKDVDILPGGEIAFSTGQDVFSETLGRLLSHGDLLSNRGTVLRTNAQLIERFGPDSLPASGVGLAAVQQQNADEIWFSVQTEFKSQTLKSTIFPGDLLSENGGIVRSNAQLLGPFGPVGLTQDVPLTAIYVWPDGEIWFCTGSAFDGGDGTHYDAGDILSDQGYIVFRRDELLSHFAPDGSVPSPAVDAMYVVTDAIPGSPAPQLNAPQLTNQPPSSLVFSWKGDGRVFQLESATNVAGPFSAVAPITPDSEVIEPGVVTNSSAGFYRLRQW